MTGLFSDRFAESAGILVLFIPLLVMRSIGAVILPGLIAANRAGTYARLTIAGAATNFVLNAFLIPRWGAEGAVISTLLSYLPIEILGLVAVSREIGGLQIRILPVLVVFNESIERGVEWIDEVDICLLRNFETC